MPSFLFAVYHQPTSLSRRTAYVPLLEILGASTSRFDPAWQKLQSRSWTLGYLLRQLGIWFYGSAWNDLVPLWDEWKLSRAARASGCAIVHFLWGEFTSPRWPGLFRRNGAVLVGTFHASARRQPSVIRKNRVFRVYDWLTVVSQTQAPFFLERGFPAERLRVLRLGVDTDFFSPGDLPHPCRAGPLRGLLVGATERDHAFLASVLKKLPPGVLEMTILTAYDQRVLNYEGVPYATFPPRLSDEELVQAYREADLLVMPMLDCTANDAMLESMACGTPVMTNRVGGVPEYVDPSCNFLMDGKNVDDWVDVLTDLGRNKEKVWSRREAVRRWAEKFGWAVVAQAYMAFYEEVRASASP